MVSHPDQEGVPDGALRFVMSLRATGEGHISSIEFRVGLIEADGSIQLDPVSRFVTLPDIDPNPSYKKAPFIVKLHEMGFDNAHTEAAMESLGDEFSRSDLNRSMSCLRRK